MTLDPQTLLTALLGLVCTLLAYWGIRLEQRVDALKNSHNALAEEIHKSYVPRTDCRERTGHVLGSLERADEKLDRLIHTVRLGGHHAQ